MPFWRRITKGITKASSFLMLACLHEKWAFGQADHLSITWSLTYFFAQTFKKGKNTFFTPVTILLSLCHLCRWISSIKKIQEPRLDTFVSDNFPTGWHGSRAPPPLCQSNDSSWVPIRPNGKCFNILYQIRLESTLACSDNSQIDHKNVLSHWRPKSLEPAGIRWWQLNSLWQR